MGPKRKAEHQDATPKRPRKVFTLKVKLEILEQLDRGLSATEVGRLHDCRESTIRTIRSNSDQIRATARSFNDSTCTLASLVQFRRGEVLF